MAGNLSLFYILLFLTLVSVVNGGKCSYSRCNYRMISFPFRSRDQPITCGLPGFDLDCNYTTRTPLLSLPSAQSFTVRTRYSLLFEIDIYRGSTTKRVPPQEIDASKLLDQHIKHPLPLYAAG